MTSVVESIGLNVRECHVYQIPPRTSNKGYRAADWKLDSPMWTGVLRVITAGPKCFVRLLDKSTGELFAQSEVDSYPGKAVEPVTDSSRYFAVRIDKGDGTGTYAFIGIGFEDRAQSFDFNVAIKDHFKHEAHVAKEKADVGPYVAKHQTGALNGPIRINIKKKSGDSEKKAAPSISLGASSGLLSAPANLWGASGPPPTTAITTTTTPSTTNPFAPAMTPSANPFAAPTTTTPSAANPFVDGQQASGGGDDWGAFSSDTTTSNSSATSTDWVKF